MQPILSNGFYRQSIAPLLLVTALAVNLQPEARAQTPGETTNRPSGLRRPSIIFIQCDSLGNGDLSCNGQTKFQTPSLDQLAADGIRFTNCQAGGANRSQARASLMLGTDLGQLLAGTNAEVRLDANDLTAATMLRQAGYHTGLIGEWELGGDGSPGAPWSKGFEEFAGYLDSADAENYYADYIWRYAPRHSFNLSQSGPEFNGREPLLPNADGKRGQYIPDTLTKAALNFIRINQPDQFNHYQPFFLLLDYATPRPNLAEAGHSGHGLQVPTDAPYSEEPWTQSAKDRAAMITRLDGDIGKLVDSLKTMGIESNTVVFFSSVSAPQKIGGVDPTFFQISSNDLRIPMIVRWPGRVPAGQVAGDQWTAADFLPTAAEIGVAKPPKDINGKSILPFLCGRR